MSRKNYAQNRLARLKEHLQHENSDLMEAVDSYSEMDLIAWRMGLLPRGISYANHISWWPLVSILGTFSAGKSSFINTWLGKDVQRSGNQAVDDRFTVLSYGPDKKVKTLPGQALDSDPRFPFYQISKDIESVSPGDGNRIDKFLQMKVVSSEVLRGKLVIDSPGFDADEQRKSTLRLTKHIVRLSDLVLVFFDARHPESGAMQDTLKHLVEEHVDSMDSEKFIYILNQIDTSAADNNLEDIVASWRSSLAQRGLSAGKFYVYFNDEIAVPVEDKNVWSTYKHKRDQDHKLIMGHLDELNTVRTYRIVGNLKLLANDIEGDAIPRLKVALGKWRNSVRITDLVLLALIGLIALIVWFKTGFVLATWKLLALLVGAAGSFLGVHYLVRRGFASLYNKGLGDEDVGDLGAAFDKNTRWFRSVWLRRNPVGWSTGVRRKLDRIRNKTEQMIEFLNSKNSDPSGRLSDVLGSTSKVKSLSDSPEVPKPVSSTQTVEKNLDNGSGKHKVD
ncbi:MAG: dynamin family protein [bacterium]|nr:dynamin family protein [bacterium]